MLLQVHLESAYQKHLDDLDELANLIQHNSEVWDVDLNTCDVETLKQWIQQNKVLQKCNSKNSIMQQRQFQKLFQHISIISHLVPGHRESSA